METLPRGRVLPLSLDQSAGWSRIFAAPTAAMKKGFLTAKNSNTTHDDVVKVPPSHSLRSSAFYPWHVQKITSRWGSRGVEHASNWPTA